MAIVLNVAGTNILVVDGVAIAPNTKAKGRSLRFQKQTMTSNPQMPNSTNKTCSKKPLRPGAPCQRWKLSR